MILIEVLGLQVLCVQACWIFKRDHRISSTYYVPKCNKTSSQGLKLIGVVATLLDAENEETTVDVCDMEFSCPFCTLKIRQIAYAD